MRMLTYFSIGKKLVVAKLLQQDWPVSVSLHVTRFCNITCTHCYAMLEQLEQKDPTLGQMKKVVDELSAGGALSIRLLGGEPLLRNCLPELIEHIKGKSMFCEIVTNGILLRKRISEWPALQKVDSFCVSLDGDKVSHDAIRGEGIYEVTMDGIFALMEAKMPLRLHGAFSHEAFDGNRKPHYSMGELSERYGIPFNIATYCPNPLKGASDEENRVSYVNGLSMYKDLLSMKKAGVPVSTTNRILEKGIKWFEHTDRYILYGKESVIPKGHKRCQAGIRNCFIDSDGSMYSCIPHWGKGISVYENGVAAAYRYMKGQREKAGCQICYNLSQWEYSNFFTFSDPSIIFNTVRNIIRLRKKRRHQVHPNEPMGNAVSNIEHQAGEG